LQIDDGWREWRHSSEEATPVRSSPLGEPRGGLDWTHPLPRALRFPDISIRSNECKLGASIRQQIFTQAKLASYIRRAYCLSQQTLFASLHQAGGFPFPSPPA
jgi:hypothetical protein